MEAKVISRIQTAGIPWFRRGDCARARSMCADGYTLPDTYDDWLKPQAAGEPRHQRRLRLH